jgi:uncharacterized protein (DUF1684 family)
MSTRGFVGVGVRVMNKSMNESGSSLRVSRVALVALCAALLLSAACAREQQQQQPQQQQQTQPQPKQQAKTTGAAYTDEVEQWKSKRLASLKGEDGWLSLVGLQWLKEGENKIGSDSSNEVTLPRGKSPRVAGSLFLSGGAVKIEARPDSGITSEGKPVTSLELKSDTDSGGPTLLKLGTLTFHVIKRGERLGVRVKDSASPERTNFRGLEYFPTDERWRVEARFEPHNPPKSIPITNVLGMEEDDPSPGAVVFDIDGKTYRLDALTEEGEEQFFIIFADTTSGKETYGAGRYLYAGPPDSTGRLLIDFNKAYSPPCAFTKYATCPLPPEQNHLPLRVEAGEKFAGHH